MSGGGGKGGSRTETVKIDPRLTEGGVQALAAALESASIPYTPARAPTIAAFTPSQQAAMRGYNDAAASFGFKKAKMKGVNPDPVTNALGMLGYSTGELYDEQVKTSVPKKVQRQRKKLVASYADSAAKVLGEDKAKNPLATGTNTNTDTNAFGVPNDKQRGAR